MASCLVSVTGTSGRVKINYKISATPHEIISDISTFYLDTTATDITYTTLYGDAVATSACLTITALPYIFYNLFWKGVNMPDYKIDKLRFGTTVIELSDVSFPESSIALINSVNSLDDYRFKITKYLFLNVTPFSFSTANASFSYILKTTEPFIPQLIIKNADNTGNIIIEGVLSIENPTGYNDAPVCNNYVAPLN